MTEITVIEVSGRHHRSLGAISVAPDADAYPDTRFRDLLGAAAWSRLPAVVRRRFSVPLEAGDQRMFQGEVVETRLSLAGRVVANLARLAGGPLPYADGATGPATVIVTEDPALGGQIWTRTYTQSGRFPQTINSVKRFSGPTGLEEYLGLGLIMRLTLTSELGDLVFRSAGYDIAVRDRRWALPRWLWPGLCTITHHALGSERFSFTLELDHPRLGRLVKQVAVFQEVAS